MWLPFSEQAQITLKRDWLSLYAVGYLYVSNHLFDRSSQLTLLFDSSPVLVSSSLALVYLLTIICEVTSSCMPLDVSPHSAVAGHYPTSFVSCLFFWAASQAWQLSQVLKNFPSGSSGGRTLQHEVWADPWCGLTWWGCIHYVAWKNTSHKFMSEN